MWDLDTVVVQLRCEAASSSLQMWDVETVVVQVQSMSCKLSASLQMWDVVNTVLQVVAWQSDVLAQDQQTKRAQDLDSCRHPCRCGR